MMNHTGPPGDSEEKRISRIRARLSLFCCISLSALGVSFAFRNWILIVLFFLSTAALLVSLILCIRKMNS